MGLFTFGTGADILTVARVTTNAMLNHEKCILIDGLDGAMETPDCDNICR